MTAVLEPQRSGSIPEDVLLAERATLGAALISEQARVAIGAILSGIEFADPRHRMIWDAITATAAASEADMVTVAKRLAAEHQLALVGGAGYLHTLAATPPTAANGPAYARQVHEAHLSRELAKIGDRLIRADGRSDPTETISRTRAALATLSAAGADASLIQFGRIADEAFDQLERGPEADSATRIPTGFVDLDRLCGGGLRPGSLTIVGALSGVGKSVFLGDLLRNAMRHKIPCCLVSLEMGRDEIWMRQAAAACRIPHHVIRDGHLDDNDWSKLARWVADTDDVPAWICDPPELWLPGLEAVVARGVEQHGWKLVLVDYLQILKHKAASREREVNESAQQMKSMGRRYGVAMVAAAQLNRGPANRPDHRPRMSDARESQGIEQHADNVILLHRDDYFDKDSPRAGETDIIVDKQRGGATDTITVASQLHLQRFVDMAVL